MANNEQLQKDVTKVKVLDEILEDVVSDSSELIKDLNWGVKSFLLFGLIMVLFGVQTLLYNIDSIQEQLYVPLFITSIMLFAGLAQIAHYLKLRKKYSRLFKAQNELLKD